MRAQLTLLLALGLFFSSLALADEQITVAAVNEDISTALDLRSVATLFGEAANLEEFENKLNNEDSHISNLDLNGDGTVDYLRVIETADGARHLIVLQAILAKDIYQDVATIYVEKDANNGVAVQVVGNEYIYGENYIIEPVYIYRPVIFDWFWGPSWVCWHSPFYWNFWPGWWHPCHCWACHDYWHHCHAYHHAHPYCSYRNTTVINVHINNMYVGRNDYARSHSGTDFRSRTGMGNASELNVTRNLANTRSASTYVGGSSSRSSQISTQSSRTFGSSNLRTTNRSAAEGARTSSGTSRSANTTARSTSSSSRSEAPARSVTTTASRSAATSATTTRSASSASSSRSASASASSSTSRSSAPARSVSTSSASRSASYSGGSSSASRSSSSSAGSYSGGSSRSSGSSYGGGSSRSSGSYSGGGSYGGGSRSAGASSGGSSRGSSGGMRR